MMHGFRDANSSRHCPDQSLAAVLQGLECEIRGSLAGVRIHSLTADSRQVSPGSLFVAVKGGRADGHEYLEEVRRRGCVAAVVESGRQVPQLPVVIIVSDTRKFLAVVSQAFYRHPARELTMIGITGTNGKTTTTYMLEAILLEAGNVPGVIGTINYRCPGVEEKASLTTPDPITLQKLLRLMADRGVSHLLMEVSSHALEQDRLAGMLFDVVLFTNLSQDHLDFHQTMRAYYEAKKKLFVEHVKPRAKQVVVLGLAEERDGGWSRLLAEDLGRDSGNGGDLIVCGPGDYPVSLRKASVDLGGMELEIRSPAGEMTVRSPLIGGFNVENILGAVGVAYALGCSRREVAAGLAKLAGIPGRMERIRGPKNIFVDFAHTPDALRKVLLTVRKLCKQRLIVVFGCGGDRDPGKRPLMGRIAGELADVIIITSDNPRSESPAAILAAIEQGVLQAAANSGLRRQRAEILLREGLPGYDIISSRKQAIVTAVKYAGKDDIVLICGKGHEEYQVDRFGKRFFDDRLVVGDELNTLPC